MQATFINGSPVMVDHTPGSAVSAADVVVVGDSVYVAHLDIAANRKGALAAGGGIYRVTAGEAIAAGKKVYWDDTNNKVVETATGNKLFGVVLPDESADADADTLLVLHWPDLSGSTYAATVAALTDNSGGAAADGTIAAVTAPTAITDNSGGAAADGTIGAVTAPTAITDNSGGAVADGTIGAVTAAAAITDNSGGVDPGNDTVAAITNANNAGSADVVPTAAAIAQIVAKLNTTRTAIVALTDAIPELTARQAENRTAIIALKDAIPELTARQTENRAAIVALTDATKELSTKINAILTALKNAGLMATA